MNILQKLAKFYDLQRYEMELREREDDMGRKLKSDLRYVEDLLVEATENPVPPKEAEIRKMVFYIKQVREEERRLHRKRTDDMMAMMFKRAIEFEKR